MSYTVDPNFVARVDIEAVLPWNVNIDWTADNCALVLMESDSPLGTRVTVTSRRDAVTLKRAARHYGEYHGIKVYGFKL